MILFPAIDIKNGQVVRLVQGKFDAVTEYSKDPMAMALHWKAQGAQWLHIIDLDGAQTGSMKNIDTIKSIAKNIGIPVQVGGGIRSKEIIADLMANQVSRVVLGTKAVEDEDFVVDVLNSFGQEKIAVSSDCINDLVTKNGWAKTENVNYLGFIEHLKNDGLKYLIYTDVARDGMLTGPNFSQLKKILTHVSDINIIASGGVSNIEDIIKLKNMSNDFKGRLYGVITGKAIYENKLNFKDALKVC